MNTEQYDVTLIGFPSGTPNGEPPIEAMQRLFQIDRPTASKFLEAMPVTVKHNAPGPVALKYRDGLQAIGARVALRPSTPVPTPASPPPSPVASPETAPVASALRPSPPPSDSFAAIPVLDGVGVTPTPTPTPVPRSSPPPLPISSLDDDDDGPGFFQSVLGCFVTPLRGQGVSWLLAAFGVALVAVIGGMVPFVGWLVQLLMGLGMLTLCARFFQSCMASTSANDDSPGGLPDLTFFFAEYILPGIALALWFVSAHVPLFYWLHSRWESFEFVSLILHPVTITLIVVPYLLWPMGLAMATSSGSFFTMWHLPRIIMGIVRAPLHYVVVLFIGSLSMLIPAVMMPILGVGGNSLLATLLVGVGEVVIMAYSHAVMGSLMGHLVRVKPEVIGE